MGTTNKISDQQRLFNLAMGLNVLAGLTAIVGVAAGWFVAARTTMAFSDAAGEELPVHAHAWQGVGIIAASLVTALVLYVVATLIRTYARNHLPA